MKRIAIYPGSFDPPTKGHEDLIHRSLALCDELIVAVAVNFQKEPLFSPDERLDMLRQLHPTLETVFLVPPVAFTYLSSSLVREVARFGGDVDAFVHPAVAEALRRKFAT